MKISPEILQDIMFDARKWHGAGFRIEFRVGYVDDLFVAEIYRRGEVNPREVIAL